MAKSNKGKKAQTIKVRGIASTIKMGTPIVTIHGPLPSGHDFYKLVGRVVSEWAHLEHALDIIIWRLSGMDHKTGSCVTASMMGHIPRFNAISALAVAKGTSDKTAKDIETLGRKISELAKNRNRFTHDAWFHVNNERVAQFVSFSPKTKEFGMKDIDEGAAHKLIKEIQDRRERLRDLSEQIQCELSSSP